MSGTEIILLGLAGSLAAGAMTAVGAVPVLFNWSMSQRGHDTWLGRRGEDRLLVWPGGGQYKEV